VNFILIKISVLQIITSKHKPCS